MMRPSGFSKFLKYCFVAGLALGAVAAVLYILNR